MTRRRVTNQKWLHYCATVQLNIERAPFVFQSLSDATRLRILRLFLASNEHLCLCDVSKALEEPTYKISRHLKALREVGILEARRDGRWLYHSVPETDRKSRGLFDCIELLPDTDGILAADLQRLKKLPLKTVDARCRSFRPKQRGIA